MSSSAGPLPASWRRGGFDRYTATMLASAAVWAPAPLVVHTMLDGTNAALAGGMTIGLQSMLLAVFLAATRKAYVGSEHKVRGFLFSSSLWLVCFRATEDGIEIAKATSLRDLTRAPQIWLLLLGGWELPLYVASTHLVETAVSTVISESLSSALVIAWMTLLFTTDRRLRGVRRDVPGVRVPLVLMAALGVALVVLSQSASFSLGGLVSARGLLGMTLAAAAATSASIHVAGSFAFGRCAFYWLTGHDEAQRIEDRGPQDRRLLLWLTLLGIAPARSVVASVQVAAGWGSAGGLPGTEALVGIALFGLLATATQIGQRVSNIGHQMPEINAIMYLAPVLGLGLLAIAGIDLPRFDLFVIGTALILTANTIMQWRREVGPAKPAA